MGKAIFRLNTVVEQIVEILKEDDELDLTRVDILTVYDMVSDLMVVMCPGINQHGFDGYNYKTCCGVVRSYFNEAYKYIIDKICFLVVSEISLIHDSLNTDYVEVVAYDTFTVELRYGDGVRYKFNCED